jgi:hypothetical protein
MTTRLWRVAGALALAHVVLMFAGAPSTPLLGDSPANVVSAYVTGSMARMYAGGYVEYLSFLVFLVGSLLIARLLRGRTEASGWLAACIGGAGITYVAVTIAAGFSAGAAALYDGHHGAPLTTITSVNDIRNFAFFLSAGVLGVFTAAVAAAGQVTRSLPRWLCWAGYVVGTAMVAAVPAARAGSMDYVTLLWTLWFVVFAVVALRGPRTTEVTRPREPVEAGI